MASVEDRIVRIEFDNSGFERKISDTLASLAQLEKAMDFSNAQKNMGQLSAAANSFDLNGMGQAIDSISGKLSAMGAIGFSVIQSLTQDVLGFIKKVGGDILDPIIGGGLSRAKNIEQAQFMFRGLGLDVEQAMASAKAAVLGTAYGLDQAAKTAAQFGAAGVAVGQDMTDALRGVAGAAAMTGSSFSEIGYIFSGIAGAGKVNTQDLMQFATRGLNAAAAIGKAMGITEQQVRDMVSNGELDFKTFATAMNTAFGEHATQANETFTGSVANMHAALARLGAAVFTPQLVNFRDIFNTLTPKIDQFVAAIKPAIDMFSLLTRTATAGIFKGILGLNFDSLKASMPDVVTGMVNVFRALSNIYNIGKQAFAQIFPPGAVPLIQKVAAAFKAFSESISIDVDRMNTIRSIFQGVFSALSIGWEIIKQGTRFLIDLGKSIAGIFGPGVVGVFTKLGDALTKLQDSLVKGGGIKQFFDDLTAKLQKPLELLQKFKDAVSKLFEGFNKAAGDAVGTAADGIGDRFQLMKDRLSTVWEPLKNATQKIIGVLEKVGGEIKDWFSELIDKIAAGMNSGDFDAVLDALNTGLLGAIALFLGRFLKGGFNINFLPGLTNLGGTIQSLTGTLQAMQSKLKSEALTKIAEAIAILAVSLLVLSTIDSASLTRALTAMSVGFGELIGTFAALEKLSVGPKGAIDFGVITGGLIVLAGAMLILSVAVKILSTLDWDGMLKGLTATTVLLGELTLATKLMEPSGMIRAGIGIAEIATGLLILSVAMKIMATMNWDELSRGLVGVSVGLGAMVLAMNLMPDELAMVRAGIGIMAIATATVILGGAVAIFASMNWESLGKGLAGLGVSLGIVVAALNLMPKDMGSSAASIFLVSLAILAMSVAISVIGRMGWEAIAKGLVAIAVSMGILVAASLAMEAGIPGAAAMVVVAGAMLVLAKVIEKIGKLSWEELARGLVGLALGIVIIAAAAVLLTPAIPEILALGAALILLGAGIALIGAGAYLLARAFQIVTKTATEAAIALPKVFEAIAYAIPGFIKGIAEGIVDTIKVFAKAAPIIAKALGTLLLHIINTLITLVPKLGMLIGKMIEELIKGIYKYARPLIDAGIYLIESFLEGVGQNIDTIVTLVADIITNFLDAMANETERVVDSLVNLFTTFFLSTAEGLGEIAGTILLGAGQAFITGFFNGASQQLNGPVFTWASNLLTTVLTWIGDALTTLWNKGVDLITGLLSGIGSAIGTVISFFANLPGAVLTWIGDTASTLLSKGIGIIGGLFRGITEKWTEVTGWLGHLGGKILHAIGDVADFLFDVGKRIIKGLWDGMKDMWDNVTGWLSDLNPANWFNDINPYKHHAEKNLVPVGQSVFMGLHNGMMDGWADVTSWLSDLNPAEHMEGAATAMSKTVGDIATKLSDLPEFQPTITPVLDLTKVMSEAGNLKGMLPDAQMVADASFTNASVISVDQQAIAAHKNDAQEFANNAPREVKFEQNITSPTPLSPSIIYKQTRNQIAMAKEELSIP